MELEGMENKKINELKIEGIQQQIEDLKKENLQLTQEQAEQIKVLETQLHDLKELRKDLKTVTETEQEPIEPIDNVREPSGSVRFSNSAEYHELRNEEDEQDKKQSKCEVM
ncbi:uncharacterized protein LOC116603404 [Nematostella vectensis]|uniref:uncharacterized protein LOC116603404 n=1 Tax=Nematostella vectensis TaxID=45351 RepID=UPI00138FF37E|nr:uncharacterized protein LOC116603404 [Nematostella vectensis]